MKKHIKTCGAFLLITLLVSSVALAQEKNSTPHFSVGELGAQWDFGSDHLPVGVTVNKRHFASWNILNRQYLHWIESNEQGLKDSAILRDDHPILDKSEWTLREANILNQVFKMFTHPTHPRSVLALEETGELFYERLLKECLTNMSLVTTFSNDLAHGDLFVYNTDIFEFVDLKGSYYKNSHNTWMMLTLKDIETNIDYTFVQSHMPGGPSSQLFRLELAHALLEHCNPNAITIVMGDQNRSADFFLKDLEEASSELGWNTQPFKEVKIPYPTHVNTLREASWIDNFFLYAPPQLPCAYKVGENAEEFFEALNIPINALWKHFPKQTYLDRAREHMTFHSEENLKVMALYDVLVSQWIRYSLDQDDNYPLESLVDACVLAAEQHKGQTHKAGEKTPYIFHPLTVCYNLWNEGDVRNPNILLAAILHDTIEATEATFESIESYFGRRVAETVEEVSKGPALELTNSQGKQRQINHGPLMSQDARLVKLADLLAHLRDLNPPPSTWSQEEVEAYREEGRKLLRWLRGTHAGLEKALEKELYQTQEIKT